MTNGAEAMGAVEAASTGHSTIFTMHAGKIIDAVNRLVVNYQRAMPQLGSDIVERIVATAIDFVCIQKHIPGIGRRVTSIAEIGFDYEKGRVKVIPIMEFNYETNSFEFINNFSQDVLSRMLGTGLTHEEIREWQRKAGLSDDRI